MEFNLFYIEFQLNLAKIFLVETKYFFYFMAISFEFLKKALLASGWVMAGIAIYNIFLCIYVTIIVEKNTDVIQSYYVKA